MPNRQSSCLRHGRKVRNLVTERTRESQDSGAMTQGNWGLEPFVEALEVVWATTPQSDRGLRDQFIPFLMKHKDRLKTDKIFVEIIRNNGDLAVDIIQALLFAPKQEKSSGTIYCQGCQAYRMS